MTGALHVKRPEREVCRTLDTALLLDAVFWYGGVDVRGGPPAAIERTIDVVRVALGEPSILGLLDRVLHQEQDLARLLKALVAVDPATPLPAPLPDPHGSIVAGWREILVPLLRSTPFPKIWVADCRDVQLLRQLIACLRMENLLPRTALFVTASEPALLRYLKDVIEHHWPQLEVADGSAPDLAIVWNDYCMHTDGTFNEFEFILCGTALPLLEQDVQRRVVRLLGESVTRCGLLQMAASIGQGKRDPSADAEALMPIFLPAAGGIHMYRHATLELRSRERQRR